MCNSFEKDIIPVYRLYSANTGIFVIFCLYEELKFGLSLRLVLFRMFLAVRIFSFTHLLVGISKLLNAFIVRYFIAIYEPMNLKPYLFSAHAFCSFSPFRQKNHPQTQPAPA